MATDIALCRTNILGRLANNSGAIGYVELRSLLFADFMVPGADPSLYVELLDREELSQVSICQVPCFRGGTPSVL